MKKNDRDVLYPVYPNYQGFNPMMGTPAMGGPMMNGPMMNSPMMYGSAVPINSSCSTSNTENSKISKLEEEYDNLEKRVSYLEGYISNNSNKYSSSNYQVM